MINFFAKRFIKDDQNYGDPRVRTAYGTLCSIAAIAFNVLLFAAKEFIGILTGIVTGITAQGLLALLAKTKLLDTFR